MISSIIEVRVYKTADISFAERREVAVSDVSHAIRMGEEMVRELQHYYVGDIPARVDICIHFT